MINPQANAIVERDPQNIGSIIRTFERYDYIIKASYQKSSNDDDVLFRYDALINYLNL